MKFLIGLFIGIIISIGVINSPEPRRQMLEAVLSWVEKVKALPVKSSASVKPSDVQKLVREKVLDVRTEFFPPELLEEPLSPGLPSSELSSPELSLTEPSLTEPSSTEPSSQELSSQEKSSINRSPSEFSKPKIGQESQALTSTLFQVAWSPFRSERSARGFASKLKQQLAHDFQVIKTGPGRYEVGFHFDSQSHRKIILSAINDLTGFESTQPPRIVQL